MMRAAMRIRRGVESLCCRRGAKRAGYKQATRDAQVEVEASSARMACKAGAFATIAVAAVLAMGGLVASVDDLRAAHASEASQNCSARYAALLDLAELARRDGKSSEVVVRGLSGQGGAMSECLRPADPAGDSDRTPERSRLQSD
jgi:hypothetical protein